MQIKNSNKALTEFKQTQKLMGNMFEITVVAESEIWAYNKIALAISEISRIENLLTTFKENSQTNLINNNAGIVEVVVDKEVLELIKRSIKISEITDGAFDLTYGSLDKSLWNFDKTMTALPSAETASKMVRLINYKNIVINNEKCSVFLKSKGMRIGFGGIGKGYAAEMAKNILIKEGVKSGIVNAAGDLTVWGTQANGNSWTVGIADPNNANLPFSQLSLSNMAIATSGNYEKYIIINGKQYSHTINPKTGLPVTGIKSVTTISPNAEIADAMATPITIMGIKAGINLVNQINQLECIIIDDFNKIYSSKNINLT
ncbi:MAG: FAD:protein FMN transferase [Deinococcales bacterium]|nr:FAD:protein FMN transferase [Chitinophagaceae bacterium]